MGVESRSASVEVVDIDTDLYRAKFSTHGAVITSWELKRYRSSPEDQPVQLVRQGAKFAGPLTVMADDAAVAQLPARGSFYSIGHGLDATEAAALTPQSAAARETLGHALLADGEPAEPNAYAAELLKRNEGHMSRAAREAGVDRKTIERMVKKHGLRGTF